jgi:hypothetical protein
MERGESRTAVAAKNAMVFDLVCRGCGTCAQRSWDATEAVSATMCPDCGGAMSVIGIDFPGGRDQARLTNVLELIQGAGIRPVAVERRARGRSRSDVA